MHRATKVFKEHRAFKGHRATKETKEFRVFKDYKAYRALESKAFKVYLDQVDLGPLSLQIQP